MLIAPGSTDFDSFPGNFPGNSHANGEGSSPPPSKNSRPPRLSTDPDKYIRRVKGGKYQARPYCSIAKVRYNLGLFPTREKARAAIALYWRTSKGEKIKFVRPVHSKQGTTYAAVVPLILGHHATAEAAAAAAHAFLATAFGKAAAEAILSRANRDGKGRRKNTPDCQVGRSRRVSGGASGQPGERG